LRADPLRCKIDVTIERIALVKLPFLKNFRRGFATNSSSSHSFVYLKRPVTSSNNDQLPDGHFNWEDFRLDTLKEKLFYVLVSRIGGFWDSVSDEQVDEAIKQHIEDFPEFSREDFREAMRGNVDHESQGLIGLEEARDPHVVIFGGNDNGGDSQERAAAVRAKEIDWSRTRPDYDDAENIPADDAEGLKKLQESRKRGW
jgi:hypothetical protein